MTNTEKTTLPLGVCVWPQPPQNAARFGTRGEYIHEILAHAGLPYRALSPENLPEGLDELRIFLTIGETQLGEATATHLREWVQDGGLWLSVGGVCGMNDLLGAEYSCPAYAGSSWGASAVCTLGEGYLSPHDAAHKILEHLAIPLHFFNGVAVEANNAAAGVLDAHGRQTKRAAIIENQFGAGRCLLIAPDAVGAIVHIQQGIAVTQDAAPAPDGTAACSDGVLKCDDGAVLDWHFDRQEIAGVPGLCGFLQPVADQWRELILRAIFYLAQEHKFSLALLWLYPRGLPAIAHLSHDTDENDPALARRLLELLDEAQIHSTWCVIAPGYDAKIIHEIRAAGHELAMHYDALEYSWSRAEFGRQADELRELFDEAPVCNKNHYTRWEGDVAFFEWCGEKGIQLDQSRGVSKSGEVGFLFGTCHPYFPIARDGLALNVLELGFVAQDLEVFAPRAAAAPLLEAAKRHHGVHHLLFHPAHVGKSEVAAALLEAVQAAKSQGLEWWTARQINDWERARRAVCWHSIEADEDGCRVLLSAQSDLRGATLLFLTDATQIAVNGEQVKPQSTTRWGFVFQAVTLDLEVHKGELS